MIHNSDKKKSSSELRFNLVCKDWVVIATGRARRPETFAKEKKKEVETPEKDCPFCHIETQSPPVLKYGKNGDWSLVVITNKFPAFTPSESLRERAEGPYSLMDGVGFHEVIVTKDHKRHMSEFSVAEIRQVLDAYQERYLELMNEKLVNYVSIFHNHGIEAGASIAHPHSQIIAIPITDPDLQSSIDGSRRFFEAQGKCVHCAMLEWDREDGRRIIFENEKFIALCPFASKVAFEVRIYPKEHHPYFERIKDIEKDQLVEALKVSLNKIDKGLNDPAYNFFIHTAPCDGKDYAHYHWHLVIFPKTLTWAGFELGTGIEISTIEPEKAAEYLRGIKN
jgi:UDPglucose--hexose-1-phosphate uridylyltransferase